MIDILLSTYNGEKFIVEQINSLLSQTYNEFRILIRDDGSSDKTVSIIEHFRDLYTDKVVLLPTTDNLGPTKSFIELLRHANAEYVMFCDQDDIWHADKVEQTLLFMQRCESSIPTLVHTDQSLIDETGHEICHSVVKHIGKDVTANTTRDLLLYPIVTGCTMMLNKPLVEKILEADAELESQYVMHDYAFSVIASMFGQICFLDKPTMQYRVHSNNVSISLKRKSLLDKVFDSKQRLTTLSYLSQSIALFEYYNFTALSDIQNRVKFVINTGNNYFFRLIVWIQLGICSRGGILTKIKWLVCI